MAITTKRIVKTGNSRLFIAVGGAGPGRPYTYIETAKAGALRWPINEPTDIEVPNPDGYDDFIVVDEVKGARQKPQLPWTNRKEINRTSLFRDIRETECEVDVQVHFGECESPRDFNGGFTLAGIMEGARTDYNTDELGALQSSERNPVNESGTFTGQTWYEVTPVTFAEKASAEVTVEIVDITICDAASCAGQCGAGSDGCQKVFALSKAIGTSPADVVRIIWSDDGGATWNTSSVSTLAIAEIPDALACVGANLVVVSEDSESHHWAAIADILAGTATWAEVGVAGGYVAAKGPRDIYSLAPTATWIVGAAGYIYFSDGIESAVEVQDAGNASVQDLNAVHATDAQNVVAVGNSNAVLRTTNGGLSWALVLGPAVGVNLTSIWMRNSLEWLVGTANGKLFSTGDGGASWTEVAFSGSGAGAVRDIAFSRNNVGWLAHDTATPKGRILRSFDGGDSWVLPTGIYAIGQNDKINALAVCTNANRVFGGGLADNGTDGYIALGA